MGEKILNKRGDKSSQLSTVATSNKKGQVTLFIILALVIAVAGVVIYWFYPQLQVTVGFGARNPTEFIQFCLEDELTDNVEQISIHGGSLNPEHYFLYEGEKIEYLCYTEKDYETCTMQRPFLRQDIEAELARGISEASRTCFEELKESYRRQGYTVNLNQGDIEVKLAPEKIITSFDNTLTLTKEDSERYTDFSIVVNNNLYELVSIAISILNYEAAYGDSETTVYMNFYHDLKVEKKKQGDGTTIYILTNRDSGDKFQFASRSVAWPSGYGL